MHAQSTVNGRLIPLCVACASSAMAWAVVNSVCHAPADVPAGLPRYMHQAIASAGQSKQV